MLWKRLIDADPVLLKGGCSTRTISDFSQEGRGALIVSGNWLFNVAGVAASG